MIIDAMGKPCPLPVLLTKKELDGGADAVTTLVDNEIAVENLRRLGSSAGCDVTVQSAEGGFSVLLVRTGASSEPAEIPVPLPPSGGSIFFIGKDHVGEGDPELGTSLMEMALFTLSKQETPPKALVFMNGGVRIPCRAGQCAEALQSLEEKGVQILVCGTCLNFYGLTDRILAGTVSNMYEILACLQSGAVISL